MVVTSRLLCLAGALAALAVGLWGGMSRLGGVIPALAPHHPSLHGPMIIGGCLGTFICLEWSAALRRPWAILAPALAASSVFLAILVPAIGPTAWLLTCASLAACAVSSARLLANDTLEFRTMVLGAMAWLVGNVSWAVSGHASMAIHWWTLFLIFAILGRRLELIRAHILPPRARRAFVLCSLPLLLSIPLGYAHTDLGVRLFGGGLVALAVWHLRWDLVCRALQTAGRYRFTAITISGGYLWLAVAGMTLIVWGSWMSAFERDAVLHALFLGFVGSMICAHIPLLTRSLLGRELAYSSAAYNHVILLNLSLILRLAGDFAHSTTGRYLGGLFNILAIAAFLLHVLRGLITSSASLPAGAVDRQS